MKPPAHAPNGVFCDDLILYGAPERGAVVARSFLLETPDLRGAVFAWLNDFQSKVRSLLAIATPGRRLKFQWSCDSDYRAELLRYHEHTQTVADPVIRGIRNERFSRYWQRMQDRELRRERRALFLYTEITHYSGNLKTWQRLREARRS